ncbi:MAG: hypothetical protein GY820_08330 [Gammaproteobacteria bacterium]|nr:hypothetical protein [Gammaproteobacteria bacterium]
MKGAVAPSINDDNLNRSRAGTLLHRRKGSFGDERERTPVDTMVLVTRSSIKGVRTNTTAPAPAKESPSDGTAL